MMTDSERLAQAVRGAVEEAPDDATNLYDEIVAVAEKAVIETVLDYTRCNQSHAAEVLGINRNTLRALMRQHGIEVDGTAAVRVYAPSRFKARGFSFEFVEPQP